MTNSYWRKRELEHMAKNKKSDAEIAKAIQSLHNQTMKEIEQQIEAFYGRYATNEGITMAEAKKRVSKLDIDEYAKKAKRYVKGAHSGNELIAAQSFTEQANAEMAIYNLTMKVNRLELLKTNIALELAAMTSDEERFASEKLTQSAREEFARQSGILGMTIAQNEKFVSSIVNASFHNATWSERLWANQAALKAELETLLTRGIIQGKNPKLLARDLRKSFNDGVADSQRLMITELARVQEEVFRESMEQAGIDKYEYIAEAGACRICAPLDGKVFKVKDGMPGSNKPPMHPNCRCSSAAYYDRKAWQEKIAKQQRADSTQIKFTEKVRADIPKEDYQKLEAILNNAPTEIKGLWQNVQQDLVTGSANSPKAFYHPGDGVNFNIKTDRKQENMFNRDGSRILGRSNYTTFYHEYGHHIDALFGYKETVQRRGKVGRKRTTYEMTISRGKSYELGLSESLKKEVKETMERFKVNSIKELVEVTKEKAEQDFSKGYSGVSDIFSGLTQGSYSMGYGHTTRYWKTKDADMLGSEAFAHMFQAYTMQGDDHDLMNLMFPETYKKFIDFVKEEGGK